MLTKAKKDSIVFSVSEEKTLISALKEKFSSTPLSLIHKLFRTKKVLVNSVPVRYYQHRIKKNSILTILDDNISLSEKKKFVNPVSPKISFENFYEDENIIIVIKDHNVETHNKKSPSASLDNAVSHYLFHSPSFVLEKDIIVSSSHRIDKLTKGLVLYAKNSFSKKIFHLLFGKKDKIVKKYIAVCSGKIKIDKELGDIKGYIYKEESQKRMFFNYEKVKEDSLECSMFVNKLSSNYNYHVFEIIIFTGRKHQIRSFFSFIGCPVIGDEKYGSKIGLKNKIKLFAYSIEFKNMPDEFSYLNNRKFEIPRIKKLVISQVMSSSEGILPKKFFKN